MNKKTVIIIASITMLFLLNAWHFNKAGFVLSPLITLSMAVLMVFFIGKFNPITSSEILAISTKKKNNYALMLHVFLSVTALGWMGYIYHLNPIDITKSDIIPLIKEVYVNRFLSGQFVYDRVLGYEYIDWTPNYLPMHWMPFLPAFILQLDPRWISSFLWITAVTLLFYFNRKHVHSNKELLFKTVLPFLFLFALLFRQTSAVAHTVELMIASWYMILGIGILYSNKFLLTIGWINTLLSRYMSVFFLPAYFITAFKKENRFKWIVLTFVFVGCLVLYVLPFLSHDWNIFFKGASAYDVAALNEWKGQSWQPAGDRPFQLFQGFGFASWIYAFTPGDLQVKIQLLKNILLLVMASSAILFMLWNYRKNNPLHELLSLFLITALFPSLSLVPYNYLFWNMLFLIPVCLSAVRFEADKI